MSKQSRKQLLAAAAAGDVEKLDNTPVEVPALVNRREDSLREMIQRAVRNEISRAAVQAGAGSFEDEDDFSIDERDPMDSPYTIEMEPLDDVPRETLDGSDRPAPVDSQDQSAEADSDSQLAEPPSDAQS